MNVLREPGKSSRPKLVVPGDAYRLASDSLFWGSMLLEYTPSARAAHEDLQPARIWKHVLTDAADTVDLVKNEQSIASELADKTQNLRQKAGLPELDESDAPDHNYRLYLGLLATADHRISPSRGSTRQAKEDYDAKVVECVKASLDGRDLLLDPDLTAVALSGLGYMSSSNRLTCAVRESMHVSVPSVAKRLDIKPDIGSPDRDTRKAAQRAIKNILRTEAGRHAKSAATI